MSKLNQEELLEKLDQWIRRVRRDEAPDNIIWHIDDDSAYQDIVALIQKPGVTEEWIEEKAKVIYDYSKKWNLIDCRDFIRSLLKEAK